MADIAVVGAGIVGLAVAREIRVRYPELDLVVLEARGRANGVPGLRRVPAAEIAELEPECRGLGALHCPGTGIVDYRAVARALEKELRGRGVGFRLGSRVRTVQRGEDTTRIGYDHGEIEARLVISCAGLWADASPCRPGRPGTRGSYRSGAPTRRCARAPHRW
jgi:L-2-hydroxyglutarate oxidase LhgO